MNVLVHSYSDERTVRITDLGNNAILFSIDHLRERVEVHISKDFLIKLSESINLFLSKK